MHQFVLLGHDGVMTLHHVYRRVLVVVVVDRISGPGFGISGKQRKKRLPLHVRWCGDARCIQEGLGIVQVLNHLGAFAACGNFSWPSHKKWCLETFVVHKALVKPAVFPQVKALIRSIYDEGVVHQLVGFQVIQDATHILIYRTNGAQVILHVALVAPLHLFLVIHTWVRFF